MDSFEDHGEDRIHFRQGEHQDVEFLQRVSAEVPSWDFIVDDGGHRAHNIKISYETLWSHVSPGGIYAIEDVINRHTRSLPIMDYFHKKIDRHFTRYKRDKEHDIKRITFHPAGLIIIEKED